MSPFSKKQRALHQWFELQVDRTPAAIAIIDGALSVSYAELDQRANRLAHWLHSQGAGNDELIGVCLERSAALLVALLAVMKAGAAYLPLVASLPRERLALMLREARPRLLLCDTASASGLPVSEILQYRMEDLDSPLPRDVPRANYEVQPHHLAYAIFTSGSTGTPKLVGVEHGSISNLLDFATEKLFLASDTRCVPFVDPIGFDSSLHQILLPLALGGTLVALPDSASLLEAGRTHAFSYLGTTPSTLKMLLDQGLLPASIHCIGMGAEVIPLKLVERLLQLKHIERLFNFYGPTEATVYCTVACLLDRANKQAAIPANEFSAGTGRIIGRPIQNSRVYVVNESGEPVATGDRGELWVAGDCVARGYLNSPASSLERFGADPFHADGGRLYCTGDQVRFLPDGILEFLGRIDDQVKIRGFRIELGEVESALQDCPDVAEGVVVARKDESGSTMLAAYVVPAAPDAAPDKAALRTFLKQKLPDYMVPSAFVVLAKLPLTPNGKVDRRALPQPELTRAQAGLAQTRPRTPTELTLGRIWTEVLPISEIGIHDNFFDLGGHSLLVAQVVSRIRREFHLEISLRAIFERPTIESMAIMLLEKQAENAGAGEMERLLTELEALPEATAASQLNQEHPASNATNDKKIMVAASPFHCPHFPSPWFGKRRCNLLILINEDFEAESFQNVARMVHEFDPLIHAVVQRDPARTPLNLPACPTLTFSPAVVRHPLAAHGKTFCGFPLSKSEEYSILQKSGFPVPEWVALRDEAIPDLAGFGDYVVRKPDYGGKGAEVKVVRKGRVRWKPITTQAAGTSSAVIVQQFIQTGPRPVNYRVNTLFGKVLYSSRYEGCEEWRPGQGGGSIVASARGSRVSLNYDEEIIRLGESAAAAFPDHPLLGFDIIREVSSGKLYILEANAIGYVWTFNSHQVADFGFSLEKQFDGLRKAAYLLAEKTQQHAA